MDRVLVVQRRKQWIDVQSQVQFVGIDPFGSVRGDHQVPAVHRCHWSERDCKLFDYGGYLQQSHLRAEQRLFNVVDGG